MASQPALLQCDCTDYSNHTPAALGRMEVGHAIGCTQDGRHLDDPLVHCSGVPSCSPPVSKIARSEPSRTLCTRAAKALPRPGEPGTGQLVKVAAASHNPISQTVGTQIARFHSKACQSSPRGQVALNSATAGQPSTVVLGGSNDLP